jgi:hypothetical protein
VFAVESDGKGSRFSCGPVVFAVPERANATSAGLFVVVDGFLDFGQPSQGDTRRTTLHFGTRVGYFRRDGDEITHVYGAHYDMDETLPGHPVFHGHLSSQDEMRAQVVSTFHVTGAGDNRADRLLRNVRTPTAQMDFFSVITQIGADHLISERSGPEVLEGFRLLRRACDFFVGAGAHLPHLNTRPAAYCYRSTHWYERKTD